MPLAPVAAETEEIQVYYVARAWHWRHMDLLTDQELSNSGATTYATPQEAKVAALLAHPGVSVYYFWVSEAGDGWHRYQDA